MDVSTLSHQEIYALAGSKARIPKGTPLIHSTHPDFKRGTMLRRIGRDTIITVFSASPYGAGDDNTEPTASWAGTGGYWKDVRLADIELVTP